jgi:hypothetical protein
MSPSKASARGTTVGPKAESLRRESMNQLVKAEQGDLTAIRADWDCPRCGSEATQRVAMLYAKDLRVSASVGLAGGIVGDHYAVLGTGSKGSSVSALGAKLAPPAQPKWSTFLAAFLIFVALFTHGLSLLVLLLIAFSHTRSKKRWQAAMAVWRKKVVCHRCGAVFQGAIGD